MIGVIEVLWLGMLLGVGAALSVGPIFVVIVQQAATSGFGAAVRVILGSATADLVLLVPALAFWIVRSAVIALAVARSRRLVGARGQAWFTAVSAAAFLGLALTLVARDVLPALA
jgi:threonine/homoserine/homoserine lactone efflux protein